MTPLLAALAAAAACFVCSTIPMVWALRLERRLKASLARERQFALRAAEADREANQWRALYYDERGVDVCSRRTQLYYPPKR